MTGSIQHFPPLQPRLKIRRAVLLLIAFAYVFVGILHHWECYHFPPAGGSGIDYATADSEGASRSFVGSLCDDCPSCSGALLPACETGARIKAISERTNIGFKMPALPGKRPDSPPPKMLT